MPNVTRTKVCLDTSYLVALYDREDVFHAMASGIREALRGHEVQLLYLDCVMNEVLNVLARRARERGRGLRPEEVLKRVITEIPKSLLTWTYPAAPERYDQCVDLMRGSSWALNFHDTLIVTAWQEIGFDALVSFDGDFDLVHGLRRLGSAEDVRAWLLSA